MDEHPSILTFESTDSEAFPLTLFVGQEPNGKEKTCAFSGTYPRVAITAGTKMNVTFWDRSYGIVGRTVDKQPAEFKRECLSRN